MNYRKTLAAFVAVAGLMCANSGYAKPNVGAKTEQESSIATWFSALFSARTDARKLGIGAEPPCFTKSSKMVPNGDRCGEEKPTDEKPTDPCTLKPSDPHCEMLKPKPCAGRQCIDPEPGP